MNHMYRTLLAAVALAFSSVTASAETITVCASGCDHTSINDAIAASSDGDVIQLAAETYFEGSQIDTLGKAITLSGVLDKAGEPASVLDGASDHRVLRCQSGETAETVFENLVIQNGYSDFDGGGMYNSSSSPTLTNCTFASNSATYGGGMFNGSSSPTLSNCTFTSNLVSGTETSSGGRGGGMYNSASSPILTDCTFTINSASGGPFAGNESGRGGGMCNVDDSSPTLTNSTFTNNSASGSKVDGGSGGG
ncbi:right-handed parallel beta-helix repeat-containing protein, partial [bacterium]|nr:right-handed parallel beta-helix repeat-containing protein [bacterium]